LLPKIYKSDILAGGGMPLAGYKQDILAEGALPPVGLSTADGAMPSADKISSTTVQQHNQVFHIDHSVALAQTLQMQSLVSHLEVTAFKHNVEFQVEAEKAQQAHSSEKHIYENAVRRAEAHFETCAKQFADHCRAHLNTEGAQANLFKNQGTRHLPSS
jgi:hypothetical protein